MKDFSNRRALFLFDPIRMSLLAAASTPGLLSAASIIASHPPTIVPVLWITETVSSIVAVQNTIPSPTQSPILSAVSPPAPPHPLAVIPIMPGPSVPHSSSTQAPPPLSTITKLLTVTETLTITVSASPSPISPPPPPPSSSQTSTSSEEPSAPSATWRAPAQMADLTAFKISKFGGGRDNLEIVQSIPPDAMDPALLLTSSPPPPDESALRLLYPAGSINPAQRPIGGAQFYAAPLDLTGARNVTLSYSVFFPADFEWVRAGKLPGLYGGHEGCSGGNEATRCFSTRLMWRKRGMGELYLYAPKDMQTASLCGDPQSTCDAAYGFSIGRGCFSFARGAWTTVTQTVTLNTPGLQDGSFTLDVNGERVLERNDVYYRGAPSRSSPPVTTTTEDAGLGGLLGPLLGDLLRPGPETEAALPIPTGGQDEGDGDGGYAAMNPMYQAQHELVVQPAPTEMESPTIVMTGYSQQTTAPPSPLPLAQRAIAIETAEEDPPVGFTGLFFSTFFGGHDERYATPRAQYVWFKDFAMSHNSCI